MIDQETFYGRGTKYSLSSGGFDVKVMNGAFRYRQHTIDIIFNGADWRLPDARIVKTGGPHAVISLGTALDRAANIKDDGGNVLQVMDPFNDEKSFIIWLAENSTANGVWVIQELDPN